MRTYRRRRSRAYLDRVIEGRASGTDPLADLIQQIQAPPRRRETRGLRAASSAFIWAPSTRPYLPPHHRTGLSSAAAQLWHPKALAAGLALIVAATIAVATTGNLPTQHAHRGITAAGNAANVTAQKSPASNPIATQPNQPGKTLAPVGPGPGATSPSPATTSVAASATATALSAPLCRQWLAQSTSSTATDSLLFNLLVRAAGGKEALNAYCNVVLNSPTAPSAPVSSASSLPQSTGPNANVATTPTPTPTPTPTATN